MDLQQKHKICKSCHIERRKVNLKFKIFYGITRTWFICDFRRWSVCGNFFGDRFTGSCQMLVQWMMFCKVINIMQVRGKERSSFEFLMSNNLIQHFFNTKICIAFHRSLYYTVKMMMFFYLQHLHNVYFCNLIHLQLKCDR